MSDFLERINKLSPKRLALLALELHEKVEAAGPVREPIAVIGMGCRLPGGVDGPDSYWELLRTGRDAVRKVPVERWDSEAYFDVDPNKPGKISTCYGGFLDQIEGFDPAFFGISPREALTMDPQQRLLLEVSWESLEHAGISPDALSGSSTGVYFGLCNSDHFQRVLRRGLDAIDAYLASGNAHSVAAGRISYCLGLQGPAIAIDTACSSSLVALHLACQSLRSGETHMALAGGVNIMCSPETTIALTKAHMLASDGRCKAFDAAADGFSRGEGCGVVVLKRLSDAQADGDRILALIPGSASNQDGRSGGLTVPNGPAQEAVIRAALADAQVASNEIGYVEAHGTGTSLGDPIEVRALAGALGAGRTKQEPLWIGSVKTNLGHLESAAGIAGVIKVILALQNETLPAQLHFKNPNPHIAWDQYPVDVVASPRAWPRGPARRVAGVSSFGFSGTNAHIIVQEAPPPDARAPAEDPRPLHCLPLSARSEDALRVLAGRYLGALSGTCPAGDSVAATLADVALTAGCGRAHLSERMAVVAADASEARRALQAFARGEMPAQIRRGSAAAGASTDVVFLYTGQGSQYAGMSRQLYDCSPVFAGTIDRCDDILGADPSGRTLKSILYPEAADDAGIHETSWTQPALFAVEYALTQLWRSWGIEPAAVLGHSVGEYVAACAAGVFTLEEGLRLIAERGRLMQSLPAGGSMAAVFAPFEAVDAAVKPFASRLSIAAINAADSVVISGEAAAVDAVLAEFSARNVQGHRLLVSFAAHSPLVEPVLGAMERCARTIPMRPPQIPVAWNVTGGIALVGGAPDARYWRDHMRQPVRFSEGIAALYAQGYRRFLEVGPHPTLIALAQRTLPDSGIRLLTSLRRGKEDWRELMTSLADLYVHGAAVDWRGIDRPYRSRRAALPTYPFERRPFWIATEPPKLRVAARETGAIAGLAGTRLPTGVALFEILLTPDTVAYLGEHRVHGMVLVAGPVFLEMVQSAAAREFGPAPRSIRDFVIREPLVLPPEGREVQIHLQATDRDGRMPFDIRSRPADASGPWQLHVNGFLEDLQAAVATSEQTFEQLQQVIGPAVPCDEFYDRLLELGIQLGPMFRTLQFAHRRSGEALAKLRLSEGCASDVIAWAHPALLDGALQSVGLALPDSENPEHAYLLTQVGHIRLVPPLPAELWCHAQVRASHEQSPIEWHADVVLRAMDGTTVGTIDDVCLRRASRSTLAKAVGAKQAGSTAGLFYELLWEPADGSAHDTSWLLPPSQFRKAAQDAFASLAQQHGLAVYSELLPLLDQLSAEHVCAALDALQFDARPGRTFTAEAEVARLSIHTRHRRLFTRLLEILVEQGVLRLHSDASFDIVGALLPPDRTLHYARHMDRFAGVSGELAMLKRCASRLAEVLRGDQDPLQLLFPNGSFAEAQQIYVDSPYARTYNGALAGSLQMALAHRPSGRRLRILEIGAGTGGTTSFVLPTLPAAEVEYVFTDLSPLFLARAAGRFADYPFVRYSILDVERDLPTQGFEAARFDVVIAANVLHATADLRATLERVQQVLAPGGLLLLLEGVAPERWVDLTFGLTEGWWRFADAGLRPRYPLIDRDAWCGLLGEIGFTDATAVPAFSADRGGAQQALIMARAASPARRWTLLGDHDHCDSVARLLRSRGDSVNLLPVQDPEVPLPAADHIVYFGALDLLRCPMDDPAGVARCERMACELPLHWLARIAADDAAGRVWLVTAGAQLVAGSAADNAAWQAPLWGVGRVFALEHPGRWGGLIDLDADLAIDDQVFAALNADATEDQSAWRKGRRFAARLVPCAEPGAAPFALRGDSTYLVTGGFGGLGLSVARWMVGQGARHLALLGRHPEPGSPAVAELERLGARVTCVAADVADESMMRGVLARLAASMPPLRGVMHAAADLSVAPISRLSPQQIKRMLGPKVAGTVLLEHLTRHLQMDFTVYFSSTTALLGAAGFAHYAAANQFMDAHALHKKRGSRVLSVNWGTWDVMRLASADDQRSYRAGGLEPMPAQRALDALGRLLAGDSRQSVVAQIDWTVLKPLLEARRPRPLLARLGASQHQPSASQRAAAQGLRQRLLAAPASMRSEITIDFVRGEAAAVLGLDDQQGLSLDTGLFDLGMDSLMSVELKQRLERGAGQPMPSTLTFNYPSVGALAAFIEKQLALGGVAADAEPDDSTLEAGADAAVDAARSLDELSDEELEARLMARLEAAR